ncbi:hypothetical protein BLNAU_18118 [Blattamonas nauphoetae]|uniref:Uncharacterized protein n=1 Tax=Blattamonas nauphoetae TaxID=2049346 RepID=A0ABQ9X9T5_9EUKA|nr:hypothetical protein BLNAU_18118 [Blattamonas nauphoetae]
MTILDSHPSTFLETPSSDCSAFVNWNKEKLVSELEKTVIFCSLVATVKIQPALDVSLEAKAARFLEFVTPKGSQSADAFFCCFAQIVDESLTNFVQFLGILISTPSQVITTAAMKMLRTLFEWCSPKIHIHLIKADLIPQIITTLNTHNILLPDRESINTNLMKIITNSFCLATPLSLDQLEVNDRNEQQAVYEAVLQQVLVPSENYISHLCGSRFSIINCDQFEHFLIFLARILGICPYHQPTMDFVLHMPVFLTIPSCLTFFDFDRSIWAFLYRMNNTQREWNRKMGEVQQIGKTVTRMLKMEGIEDVMEEKLQNDRNAFIGDQMVAKVITLNSDLGMNLPRRG